jgi:hypothetical protein
MGVGRLAWWRANTVRKALSAAVSKRSIQGSLKGLCPWWVSNS